MSSHNVQCHANDLIINCLFRPRSWLERDRGSVEYHCYSQLMSYIQDSSPISTTTTTTSQTEGECPQSSLAQSSCDDLELELELSGELTDQ